MDDYLSQTKSNVIKFDFPYFSIKNFVNINLIINIEIKELFIN